MWISMSSVCKSNRKHFHRKGKKLRVVFILFFFSVEMRDAHFCFKIKNALAFCYCSPFPFYQNSTSQPVQQILSSLKSVFCACLFNRNLSSWDHFALTELHLNQQTVHWGDSVWIHASSSHTQLNIDTWWSLKATAFFWQLCGKSLKPTQCLNFIFPWN